MPDNQPDTPSDCPPDPAAGPNTDQSPADRLKELQKLLKGEEEQLGTLTKERDALKSDVEALAKTVDEIEKAKAAYAKGFPDLNEKKGAAEKYHGQKIKMVEAALGEEKKKKVVEKITEVEKKISDKKIQVETARAKVTETNAAQTAAQKDLEAKQAKYEEQKNLEKTIGDNLQKLNDFRTKVEKNDDPPKPATMYVYLREMKTVANETYVPNQDQYEKELTKRWKDLDGAKETARKTKLAWEAAKATLASEEAVLAALQKGRVDDLVTATAELNNSAGAAAAGS